MNSQLLTSALGSTGSSGLALLPILLGIWSVLMIGVLIITILKIIATWIIFTKADEKGWKSLIPIYNSYILFKIAGRSFWKYILIGFVTTVLNEISKNVSNSMIALILMVIAFAFSIWLLVETIKYLHGLSKNFGHGAGFTVGLIFLNTIFLLILAFGRSEYQGIKE